MMMGRIVGTDWRKVELKRWMSTKRSMRTFVQVDFDAIPSSVRRRKEDSKRRMTRDLAPHD